MDARDEVEFFTDPVTCAGTGSGSSFVPEDDAVEFGRSGVPRWAIALAGVAVAVLVAGLAGQARHRPSAHAPTEPLPVASPSSTSGLGEPIPIQGVTPAIDLAVSVPLFLLQPGHLYKFTDTSLFGVTLDGPGFARVGTSAELVVDAAANRVWVVDMHKPDGEIVEFDSRNLRRLRTMRMPESIGDAAALRGHLYLAANSGLFDIVPGAARPRPVSGMGGYVVSVAADPKRARLVALVLGAGTWVRALSVNGVIGSAEVELPLAKGNIRVTQAGTIWVAGYGLGSYSAILARLDPATLRPLATSPLAAQLGPGGWIESAGDRDIWVRRGGDGAGLWCVNGRTGEILQHWPQVPGAVTSHLGTAYVLTAGALVPLVLSRCGG